MTTPKPSNDLIHETSPYLLQHAHNPVNWMPWGEKALQQAKELNKPILLSIGYSTCHWCHVMEKESFENEAIAEVMNDLFVNIKVDREERPDLDLIYMTYAQAVNGSGGWPMNVWLTPELTPFYAGTYYPPEDRGGRMGFPRLCQEIAKIWTEEREQVSERSRVTIEKLQGYLDDELSEKVPDATAIFRTSFDALANAYDYHEGGFSGAPKFPRPANLLMLWRLRQWLLRSEEGEKITDANWAESMAKNTLIKMSFGGMRDLLGGGFHRYSVDAFWHVPHFEKMLYDQGQLVEAYVEGYQHTNLSHFLDIARSTANYALKDLRHEDGGFFSAEDADSFATLISEEKTEGAFYVWTAAEIDEILGKTNGNIFRYAYGARRDGNARAESDPHGDFRGLNTLFRAFSAKKTAEFFKLPVQEVQQILAEGREKLAQVRATRPRPHLDDKVITAWNGMMITGLAKLYQVTRETSYLDAAKQAAQFLYDHLSVQGRDLKRSYREGLAKVSAFPSDYAQLIQALIDLYESEFELRWLVWAVQLQEELDQRFGDTEGGGYYSVRRNEGESILQIKEDYDGAEPSPNSVSARNLLRLSALLGVDSYREKAEAIFRLFASSLERNPTSVPILVSALADWQSGGLEIVIAGESQSPSFEALLAEIHSRYLPHAVVLHADGAEAQAYLAQTRLGMEALRPVEGQPTVYLCANQTCSAPITDLALLKVKLDELQHLEILA